MYVVRVCLYVELRFEIQSFSEKLMSLGIISDIRIVNSTSE